MRYEKIAPELIGVFQDFINEGPDELSLYSRTLDIHDNADIPESPGITVFLHCDETAEFDHLSMDDIQVNAEKGVIRTAILPLKMLERLAEEPAVSYISPSFRLYPLMDVAPSKVQLPQFRQNTKLTGKGVIIGVVDSGIDATHPAFRGRILRIREQSLRYRNGRWKLHAQEFRGSELTKSRDTDGHGTHVAGIAAGKDETFGGVAPEAELVIVKTELNSGLIAEGVRYIFDVARELGRPAVVNLSLGGHSDAHDGSDGLSRTIDRQSGEGRIVCCAAGNEGNDNIHAQAQIPQNGDPHTIRFFVPSTSGETAIKLAALNGWYSGQDEMEVAVQSPSAVRTSYQGIIREENVSYGRVYNLPDAQVRIFTPAVSPRNGDHSFRIELRSHEGSRVPVTPGVWKLWVRGRRINKGRVDVWALDNSPRANVIFMDSVSDSLKIGSPGASHKAITVASYTTKVEWRDIDEEPRRMQLPVNDISEFSSEGPLRDGTQKPDVAAPGAFITSCQSDDARFPRWLQINSHYVNLKGTSMSSPFISGIVALLLERDPTLSPERIKALFQVSSSIPGHPEGTFHPKWGFGLINAFSLADAPDAITS